MAGWPQQNHDKQRRVEVAIELGRQEFWKAAYVASLAATGSDSFAVTQANNALSAFDLRFGGP